VFAVGRGGGFRVGGGEGVFGGVWFRLERGVRLFLVMGVWGGVWSGVVAGREFLFGGGGWVFVGVFVAICVLFFGWRVGCISGGGGGGFCHRFVCFGGEFVYSHGRRSLLA